MKFYYLIHLQYLGFRFHGWQKQTSYKTVQEEVETALKKYLKSEKFQIISASRTDSMVSANHSMFELISEFEIKDVLFVKKLNLLLPADIKVLKMESTDRYFKIIEAPKVKEYLYFFSFGEKNHPFAAPFITHINEELDIDLMSKAARCFEGVHHFKNYCFKPRENQVFDREIERCEIEINKMLNANFFPEQSYLLRVVARSFMRHQVRKMAGALFLVGMKKLTMEDFLNSLDADYEMEIMIAPASGLMLNQIEIGLR